MPAPPPVTFGADVLARAARLSTASLHEAGGRIGALPHSLRPIAPHLRVCGRAFPVRCPAGDNLFLHHAIVAASAGDVLVVDAGDGDAFGHWGDILAAAAQKKGIAGLVITGGIRDSLQQVEMGFPVFSRSVAIHGTAKDPAGAGSLGAPIRIGGVTIESGDLVVGDADGLVVLPAAAASSIVDKAIARDREEEEIRRRIDAGETTVAIYKLPPLAAPRRAATRRRSIEVEGLKHTGLPIPAASRVGPFVATGGVRGVDRETGEMPSGAEAQAKLMFKNLQTIVEAAGASVNDILKLTIWIAAPEFRPAINPPWLEMFPDPESRPARHILIYTLPGNMLIQCEALAVAKDERP